ncbi:MAG: glutathionylspermidine synthase family protein [Arsenophonus sp. ER-LPS3-MAG3]
MVFIFILYMVNLVDVRMSYYQFTMKQIEDLETTTSELYQMCLQVVEKVVNNEELLIKFQIPKNY